MRIAADVSNEMGILSHVDHQRQERLLNSYGVINQMPFGVSDLEFINKLKKDKLSINGNISLVLLEKIGKFKVYTNIDEGIISRTVKKYSASTNP